MNLTRLMSICSGICSFTFFFITPSLVLSQQLDSASAASFARDFFWKPSHMPAWFDPASRHGAERFGISYRGVECKNLIGYDFSDSVRADVRAGRIKYRLKLDTLNGALIRLSIVAGSPPATKSFLFRNKQCISLLSYETREWGVIVSTHFRFHLSDTTLFNMTCVDQLERFVATMVPVLGLTAQNLRLIEQEKIDYYLCKDEDEIERITGYRARGMCNLAYDALVTTYNVHRHELVHLLMNFALRKLPLYTHPFLQEGLAVAFGGRGGLSAEVLLPVGEFGLRMQLTTVESLLNKSEFEKQDASLTYSASGYLIRDLIASVGSQGFKTLYLQHSGDWSEGVVQRIDSLEFPAGWLQNLKPTVPLIEPGFSSEATHLVDSGDVCILREDNLRYYFALNGWVAYRPESAVQGYRSTLFRDLVGGVYRGERYLVRAGVGVAAVYDLLTNTLVANFTESFSATGKRLPMLGGRYCFSVPKVVFESTLGMVSQSGGN